LEEVRKGMVEEDNKQTKEITELVLVRSKNGYRSTEYCRDLRPNVLTYLLNDNFKVSLVEGLPQISWEEDRPVVGFSLYNLVMHNLKDYEKHEAISYIRNEIIFQGKSSVEFKHIDPQLTRQLIEEGFHYLPTPEGGARFSISS
jgi:hypothetical protein